VPVVLLSFQSHSLAICILSFALGIWALGSTWGEAPCFLTSRRVCLKRSHSKRSEGDMRKEVMIPCSHLSPWELASGILLFLGWPCLQESLQPDAKSLCPQLLASGRQKLYSYYFHSSVLTLVIFFQVWVYYFVQGFWMIHGVNKLQVLVDVISVSHLHVSNKGAIIYAWLPTFQKTRLIIQVMSNMSSE
jgi:hypothetical protein